MPKVAIIGLGFKGTSNAAAILDQPDVTAVAFNNCLATQGRGVGFMKSDPELHRLNGSGLATYRLVPEPDGNLPERTEFLQNYYQSEDYRNHHDQTSESRSDIGDGSEKLVGFFPDRFTFKQGNVVRVTSEKTNHGPYTVHYDDLNGNTGKESGFDKVHYATGTAPLNQGWMEPIQNHSAFIVNVWDQRDRLDPVLTPLIGKKEAAIAVVGDSDTGIDSILEAARKGFVGKAYSFGHHSSVKNADDVKYGIRNDHTAYKFGEAAKNMSYIPLTAKVKDAHANEDGTISLGVNESDADLPPFDAVFSAVGRTAKTPVVSQAIEDNLIVYYGGRLRPKHGNITLSSTMTHGSIEFSDDEWHKLRTWAGKPA
jgi:hypothetical protein